MAVNLDDLKKLSWQMKALLVMLLFLLLGYFYYFYFLQTDWEKRGQLRSKLQDLEQQVVTKERLAAELGKYIKNVEALKLSFNTALTKLPIRKEIPELLTNVALSGKNTGVSFLLFEPQQSVKKIIGAKGAPDQKTAGQKPADQKQEQKQAVKKPGDGKAAKPVEEGDYYEEIPVKVTVKGTFRSTVAFFEKVATLPRIINVEDIIMSDGKLVKGQGPFLNTSCLIKTYMFIQKKGDGGEQGKKTDEKKKS